MASKMYNSPGERDCCTVPPVVTGKYELKGKYRPFGGLTKVYFTGGSKDSGKAIITVYDVFGLKSQTLQGADIVARSLGIQVIVPDFFDGYSIPEIVFPPSTLEDKKLIDTWRDTTGDPMMHMDDFYAVTDALRSEGFTKIGATGFCWGGKLITVAGRWPEKLDAIASVHPGGVTADDAVDLAIR
ncbi:hypothetical protein FRB97_004948 [Tulasnella sp. 331]|nr:hypothetical protein FRB97_004948 [Tulasnella sp. 331]